MQDEYSELAGLPEGTDFKHLLQENVETTFRFIARSTWGGNLRSETNYKMNSLSKPGFVLCSDSLQETGHSWGAMDQIYSSNFKL